MTGLEKNLQFKVSLIRTSISQILLTLGKSLVGRRVAGSFAHWASENEKVLAHKENLLVLDNRTALFFEPRVNIGSY